MSQQSLIDVVLVVASLIGVSISILLMEEMLKFDRQMRRRDRQLLLNRKK